MRQKSTKNRGVKLAMLIITFVVTGAAYAQDSEKGATSYSPVDIKEKFASIMARMKAGKPAIMKRQPTSAGAISAQGSLDINSSAKPD